MNGSLRPLTGASAGIELPTPQPQGLKLIPGEDPNHQFQAPGPTDQRGICPTLKTLANQCVQVFRSYTIKLISVAICLAMALVNLLFRPNTTLAATDHKFRRSCQWYPNRTRLQIWIIGLLVRPRPASRVVTSSGASIFIRRADARVPNTIGPALGLDKHGVFEIDGSITHQDTYFGNNANVSDQTVTLRLGRRLSSFCNAGTNT